MEALQIVTGVITMSNNDDSTTPAGPINLAAQTVELDAKALRKLVVSTILDLGDESGSIPVRLVPPPAEAVVVETVAAAAAGDDDQRV